MGRGSGAGTGAGWTYRRARGQGIADRSHEGSLPSDATKLPAPQPSTEFHSRPFSRQLSLPLWLLPFPLWHSPAPPRASPKPDPLVLSLGKPWESAWYIRSAIGGGLRGWNVGGREAKGLWGQRRSPRRQRRHIVFMASSRHCGSNCFWVKSRLRFADSQLVVFRSVKAIRML